MNGAQKEALFDWLGLVAVVLVILAIAIVLNA